MTIIYTLKLENDKYYIGRSNIPKNRILDHFSENGSEWTKKYKPIKVMSQINGDPFDEEKHTLIAMDKYGVDNVRGGSYCKIELSDFEREKALQTIRSITDKCYECGESGHFTKECNKSIKQKHVKNFDEICDQCFGTGQMYVCDDVYLNCFCIGGP